MCRNVRTLFNLDPPADDEEVRDAALQFVRKPSGFANLQPQCPDAGDEWVASWRRGENAEGESLRIPEDRRSTESRNLGGG